MNNILISIAVMGGLGLLFGAILAIAYRFLRVWEDPRLDQIEEMLPGTNCGACGEPGCRAFATKLLANEKQPGQCTVSSAEGIELIAEFLGVDPGGEEKRVARLRCAGGLSSAKQIAEYEGYESCRAASTVSSGGKGCPWGCLGLADCAVACTFDAITMNEEGLPVVDPELCTACGDCVEACPRDLFEIVPVSQQLYVQCNSPLAGEDATALCTVACDACGRCVQDAPDGLMEMVNNLPVVDYSKGLPITPEPTYRCPTGAIQWLTDRQFIEQEPKMVSKK